MTETKENCRKQTGNLKINNKLYPIYEGLNIIGRDAKSTIILKETIFSKLHAAISVVDANTHLICDLNSSNGTQLGKLKLIPYKFYSIKDHEPVIFGDVVAMYFKGTEIQNNCVVKMSSQNVDHEASTQILNNLNNTVENIHDLPTQPFVADADPVVPTHFNIHEAPTQIFPENKSDSLNIHEAPTQIFPDTNNVKNNIHEAETQYLPETNKSKNIHEDETQFFPDTNKSVNNIHEAPTQYFKPDSSLNENNTSNYNINDSDDDATQDDLDPQIIVETPKVIEICPEEAPNTQNDDDDLLSRTDVYDDIFANETFRSSLDKSSAEIDEAIEVDETLLVASQKNTENVEGFRKPEIPRNNNDDVMSDDDDIILSTQDSEAIDQKFREHQEKLNSTMDKPDEKVTEEVCDSDATDVEDEELLIANVAKLRDSFEVPETPETPEKPEIINAVSEEIKNVNDEGSDDEELDLLASTASKSDDSEESVKSEEVFIKEAELAPTQLLTPSTTTTTTTITTEQAINSSDDETDDELPATQLLHLVSKKCSKEKDDVFLAPTKLIPKSAEKKSKTNKDDDIFLAATQKLSGEDEKNTSVNEEMEEVSAAPKTEDNEIDEEATQMLPPEVVKTPKNISHKDDGIFSAATQLLPPDEFEVATQILPFEPPLEPETKANPADPETTKPIGKSKNNEDEHIFSAATQLLPNNSETRKNQVENDEENIFSAATQILEENPKATKSTTENEEENIFSAPTQLLEAREPENDDIFLAPTQVLLEDGEPIKKSNDSVRFSSESNEDSMRLHLSETEPSTCNLNQEQEICVQQQQQQQQQQEQQQNTETQLEVSFELETQKLYVEERTRRPDNPLSHLFAEEATEMTEQYSEADDAAEDGNTSIDNKMQLKPIVSVVDIKKSKITLKDIQEASTSKIKKSYVKLERIRQEPTRRSNRNAKLADSEESIEETKVEAEENVKTTRRQTKLTSVSTVSEKQESVTSEDNVEKEVKTTKRRTKYASNETSPRKAQKQDKTTNEEISEAQEKATTVKEKETEEIKKSNSKTKISKSAEETPENSEEADFVSSRHNTRGRRRDYKSICKGISAKPDENESKNARGRITSKSFIREKIEELEIHVKEEKPKSIEEIDSDDSVSISKRLKRNNRKESETETEKEKKTFTVEDTDESSIEINIRKKVPRIEDSQQSETRSKRNTKRTASSRTASEADETNNSGRNKRVLKNAKLAGKPKDINDKIEIEDSDESILETRKKEAANSVESAGRTQTRKRNVPISPERNNRMPASDICLNTPNSKRRKYEPLSVNISSSQLNSDALAEHKVVFTMLNDTNLENIVRKLGGSVVDSIHVCTVLVTNKISRSLKFLIAVALGKPIVHLKWIMDSEKRKKFLDPWDYLLEDTESEAKFHMSLKESLTTSRNKKLMTGETILLAAAKNFDVLKEIIETSGGKCITRAPPKNTKTVVVCYEDEKSKYSRYLKQKTLIVVSAEAIFSGVLQQKLNWKQYVLS